MRSAEDAARADRRAGGQEGKGHRDMEADGGKEQEGQEAEQGGMEAGSMPEGHQN